MYKIGEFSILSKTTIKALRYYEKEKLLIPRIIIDGADNAVTAIINTNIVPIPTPFKNRASAIGIVPNISAYIGIPTTVAIILKNNYSDLTLFL